MRKLALLCILISMASTALCQRNPVFAATVVGVISGDTMRVKIVAKGEPANGKEFGLRLWGVAAPKPGDAFAREAKGRLTKVALHRTVIVEDWGHDKDGDVIGQVFAVLPSKWLPGSYFSEIRGKDGPTQQIILNEEMVSSGLAIPLKVSESSDLQFFARSLQQDLEAAKKAKRGIWSK